MSTLRWHVASGAKFIGPLVEGRTAQHHREDKEDKEEVRGHFRVLVPSTNSLFVGG